MSVHDFFDGIIKHKRIIAFLVAAAVVLCTFGLNVTESNTAKIVIKYLGNKATQGLTENGEEINPYEISSPTVIKNAALQLGFTNVNVEEIRRDITITPIIPTAEEEKYASWIKNFSNYDDNEDNKEHTVYYAVSFTSSHSKDYTMNMLSAIINQYRLYYVGKYTNNSDITELSGEAVQQYDYYETVDLLRKKINSNVKYLNNIVTGDFDYRSHKSGYSMQDLITEYRSLTERDLAICERMILESGAAKDAALLRDNISDKIIAAQKDSDLNAQNAQTNLGLMRVFAEKNQQYLWDEFENDEEQSSQVREEVERDEVYTQEKSTYDELMLDYVKYRTDSENLLIDKAYYENAKASFGADYSDDAMKQEIEKNLAQTCNKFNEIYNLTKATIEDYNEFKSSRSIENISGVIVQNTVNSVFYYGVSVILAFAFGIVLCVVVELFNKKKQTQNDEA